MTRTPFYISSWVISTLTISVVGLTPLCASGAQEAASSWKSPSITLGGITCLTRNISIPSVG